VAYLSAFPQERQQFILTVYVNDIMDTIN